MNGANMTRAQCGHAIAKTDNHCFCWSCRTNPKKRLPKQSPCQTVGDKIGSVADCEVCQGVSKEVRDSWVPKRPYKGTRTVSSVQVSHFVPLTGYFRFTATTSFDCNW